MIADSTTCEICDETAETELLQECFECGRTFHLNPYNNRPGKDCGDALIGASFGVHYYCTPCLEAASGEANSGGAASAAPPPPPARSDVPRRRYRRQEPS